MDQNCNQNNFNYKTLESGFDCILFYAKNKRKYQPCVLLFTFKNFFFSDMNMKREFLIILKVSNIYNLH